MNGFSCSHKHCSFDPYDEGDEYGYYSRTDQDCGRCVNRCKADANCGAVECGDGMGYCSWWKGDTCSLDNAPATNPHGDAGFTCRPTGNCFAPPSLTINCSSLHLSGLGAFLAYVVKALVLLECTIVLSPPVRVSKILFVESSMVEMTVY